MKDFNNPVKSCDTYSTLATYGGDESVLCFTDIVTSGGIEGNVKYIPDNNVYNMFALKSYLECLHDGHSMILPAMGWNVSLVIQHDDTTATIWVFGTKGEVYHYIDSLN